MSQGRDEVGSSALSPYIENIVSEIAREFHDDAPASSRTQAYNIWDASGLAEEGYGRLLYVARARTRERGNIEKPAASGGVWGARNRMPYFWAVLRSLLKEEGAHQTNSVPAREGRGDAVPSTTVSIPLARAMQGFECDVEIDEVGVLRVDQPFPLSSGRYRVIVVIHEQIEG